MEERMPAAINHQDAGTGTNRIPAAMADASWEAGCRRTVAGSAGDVPARPSFALMCLQYAEAAENAKAAPKRDHGQRRSISKAERRIAAERMDESYRAVMVAMRAAKPSRSVWWDCGAIAAAIEAATGRSLSQSHVGMVMKRAISEKAAEGREFRGRRQWRMVAK